ncbi:MAG: hypothetical protein M1840_002711 [Geoglossum simile]|nr:MAG: hypothetical protein M1840_002711 [Geoglossum simile]
MASSFLTKCVNRECSTAPYDLAQAVSVYDGYCGRQQQQVATTSVDPASPTVIIITTVTSTSGGVTITMTPVYFTALKD